MTGGGGGGGGGQSCEIMLFAVICMCMCICTCVRIKFDYWTVIEIQMGCIFITKYAVGPFSLIRC